MNVPKKYRDLAARAGWTAAQAGLGLVTVEALDLPAAWAPIIAVVLSALKSFIATKVGDPSTATFAPAPVPAVVPASPAPTPAPVPVAPLAPDAPPDPPDEPTDGTSGEVEPA